MYTINDEHDFQESMALRYPKLMEKSNDISFGVGAGWYPIIDALMHVIYQPYQQAIWALDGASKYPRNDNNEYLDKCLASVAKEEEDLPVILQVKEKFGTLRFYTNYETDSISSAILFAEIMSGRTCERCSQPGYQDGAGWVKTFCKFHHEENGTDFD